MTCTKKRTITMGKTSNRKRLAIKLNDHIFQTEKINHSTTDKIRPSRPSYDDPWKHCLIHVKIFYLQDVHLIVAKFQ